MKHITYIILLLSLLLSSTALAINEVELVKNFDDYPRSSFAGELIVIGDKLFFSNRDEQHGEELWILDSPTGTPRLVKDIAPDTQSSYPGWFTEFLGKLYFSAQETDSGDSQLWMSDGTEAGTVPVGVAQGQALPLRISELTVFGSNNERLGFAANEVGPFGREFCISNGSANNTLCYDLKSGPDGSSPRELTNFLGDLIFSADNGIVGRELWGVGVNLGTPKIFQDINTGIGSSFPSNFTVFENPSFGGGVTSLIFQAQGVSGDSEPHIMVTTGALVQQLIDLNGNDGSNPYNFTAGPNGGVFFTARTNATGEELWYSNGSAIGTIFLKDIHPGIDGGRVGNMIPFGNGIFFEADDGTTGEEIWKSDGTPLGTQLVKDIEPFASYGAGFQDPLVVGNKLIFTAETLKDGQELFMTDGTTAGTDLFKDIRTGSLHGEPRDAFMLSGKFGVTAFTENSPGIVFMEPSTGDITSTIPLIGVQDRGSYPREMADLSDGNIFVSMENDIIGQEPYSYNPVTNSFTLLHDIFEGPDSSSPRIIGTVNNKVVFSARNRDVGQELWATDGTSQGTMLLKDISPNNMDEDEKDSNPRAIEVTTEYNGYLFFTANTPGNGRELWKTDGTNAGTMIVKDILQGSSDSGPRIFVKALGGQLFFLAEGPSGEHEIFKTDGTENGTVQITDYLVSGVRYYSRMHEHEGFLYFGAENNTVGRELFRSNGEVGNLSLVVDIEPGASNSIPNDFYSLNGTLLISVARGSTGPRYYRLQAPYTQAELELLVDPSPTTTFGNPGSFFSVYDKVLFTTITDINGQRENTEPWITDGTPAGTNIFKIIQPGGGATEMSSWYRAGDYYYFAATKDDTTGNELWRSDGTPQGTDIFKDLRPGKDEANPDFLGVHRGALYFTYFDPKIDSELWRIVFDECPDDPNKIEFGQCGCGAADIDSDGDGVFDCSDACSSDALKTTVGVCGCGIPETDSDGDGTPDCADSCSADALKATAGSCGCGVPDVDLDASGVPDCLIAQEITVRSDLLATLLGDFKRKPKKGRKLRARAIFQAYKELNRFSRSQLAAFVNSTAKKTKKRLKNLRRKIKKFRSKANNKNKRKAIKALARFLAIAP